MIITGLIAVFILIAGASATFILMRLVDQKTGEDLEAKEKLEQRAAGE